MQLLPCMLELMSCDGVVNDVQATFDELMDTAFQTAFGSITVSEPNPPKVSLSMPKGPSGEDRASATGMSFVVSPPGKGRAVKKPVVRLSYRALPLSPCTDILNTEPTQ